MSGGEGSLIRAIRGPVTMITLGVLFLLDNFTPYGFGQTWPVLLIVFGLLSLLGRGGEPRQPYPYTPGAPAPAPPPPASEGPGYRQSPYPTDKSPGGVA